MFRKIIHIILLVYLLVATTGITFSVHYCRGEYVSASIDKEAKPCCNGKDKCCKDKIIHFEVKDNYDNTNAMTTVKTVDFGVLIPFIRLFKLTLIPETNKEVEKYTHTLLLLKTQTRLSLLQTYLC